ncbi:hypothetical protein HDU96_010329 [Phlyctochytrium bullatum]|nr:hypothetical protein HDU96_010329 [Phlyctochytrium bullatum]
MDGNDLIRLRNYNYDPVTNLLAGLVHVELSTGPATLAPAPTLVSAALPPAAQPFQ